MVVDNNRALADSIEVPEEAHDDGAVEIEVNMWVAAVDSSLQMADRVNDDDGRGDQGSVPVLDPCLRRCFVS